MGINSERAERVRERAVVRCRRRHQLWRRVLRAKAERVRERGRERAVLLHRRRLVRRSGRGSRRRRGLGRRLPLLPVGRRDLVVGLVRADHLCVALEPPLARVLVDLVLRVGERVGVGTGGETVCADPLVVEHDAGERGTALNAFVVPGRDARRRGVDGRHRRRERNDDVGGRRRQSRVRVQGQRVQVCLRGRRHRRRRRRYRSRRAAKPVDVRDRRARARPAARDAGRGPYGWNGHGRRHADEGFVPACETARFDHHIVACARVVRVRRDRHRGQELGGRRRHRELGARGRPVVAAEGGLGGRRRPVRVGHRAGDDRRDGPL
jgi:hypothetical protein